MKKYKYLIVLLYIITACQNGDKLNSIEKWKNEILNTEREFAKMAREEGIPKAFLAFSANDAVLLRNNRLINGKDSIRVYFEKSSLYVENIILNWEPDFVDVSASGDLGYTYGKYTYSVTDSIGNKSVSEGVFHTVWKRQPDGKWRFVWD